VRFSPALWNIPYEKNRGWQARGTRHGGVYTTLIGTPSANGKRAGGDRLAPFIYGDPDLGLARRSPRRSPEFPSTAVACLLAWRAEPMCCRLDSAGDKIDPDIFNASRVLPMFPPRKTGRFMHEPVAALEFFGKPIRGAGQTRTELTPGQALRRAGRSRI
jgi:hypothetical protein